MLGISGLVGYHCWISLVYVAEWLLNVTGRHNSMIYDGVHGQSPTGNNSGRYDNTPALSEYSFQPDSMSPDHGKILVR